MCSSLLRDPCRASRSHNHTHLAAADPPPPVCRASFSQSAASLAHSGCSQSCSIDSFHGMATEQKHSTYVQQVLAAHKQPPLLAALMPLLPSQQPWQQHQHQLGQFWQQLWPSQRRAFCSSAALREKAAWPNAVPSLHQPHKHSAGRLLPKPPAGEPGLGGGAAAADGAAATAAHAPSTAAAETLWARHRIPIIMIMLFMTGATTSESWRRAAAGPLNQCDGAWQQRCALLGSSPRSPCPTLHSTSANTLRQNGPCIYAHSQKSLWPVFGQSLQWPTAVGAYIYHSP